MPLFRFLVKKVSFQEALSDLLLEHSLVRFCRFLRHCMSLFECREAAMRQDAFHQSILQEAHFSRQASREFHGGAAWIIFLLLAILHRQSIRYMSQCKLPIC